jgi:hypothetical protein
MMAGISSCYYDNREELFVYVDSPPCEFTTISFTTDIVPILDQHCVSCHRPADQQGGIDLVGHNEAVKYAKDGSLFGSVNHNAGYVPMPFGTPQISPCDIQKLKAWIDTGALNN